jgi:hypothetical protein
MAFTPITITFTDDRPDSGAGSGKVTATLSEAIQNGTEVIDPTPIVGILNASGQLKDNTGLNPFTLVANDDAGTTPAGSTYLFVIQLDSAPLREGSAVVPHAAAGGTIDLSVLVPAP